MRTHLCLCLISMLPSPCLHLVEHRFFWTRCRLYSQHFHVPNDADPSRCGNKGKSNGRFEERHFNFSVWLKDILAKNSSLGQCSSTETTSTTVHWLLLTSPASGLYCHNKAFWILSVPSCLWCLLVSPDAPIFWKKPLDKQWLLILQPVFCLFWLGKLPSSRSLHQQPVAGTGNGHTGVLETKGSREFMGQVAANNQ